ncbi:TPA: DUF2513 domain-containing protein [Clostridioides difficile]|nr:DUF2513 domain-containing protein [Clostridioides difficile]
MKLNPDCIRDLLLTVEENTSFSQVMYYNRKEENNYDLLQRYSDEEISYHIRQCNLYGFFTRISWTSAHCTIDDLTPLGHEFLANVRLNTNWNKTKEVASKVGSTSINVLTEIASNVITNLISNNL